MESKDFIIVGQGIAGILIGFRLMQHGFDCVFIDKETENTASRFSGALLNPNNLNVGKEFPKQQQELAFAIKSYQELSSYLSIPFCQKMELLAFDTVK